MGASVKDKASGGQNGGQYRHRKNGQAFENTDVFLDGGGGWI
jgi:hypothetical protein